MDEKVEFVFKKYDGTVIENPNQYLKEWIIDNPHGNIFIGCDSQQHKKYIKYAISIIMHRMDEEGLGHGAHVIFTSYIDTNKSLKTDLFTKLWAEAEYTLIVAKLFEDFKKKIEIHLDYNSDESSYSNVLYNPGIGYFTGQGFKTKGKPYAYAASNVADNLCK